LQAKTKPDDQQGEDKSIQTFNDFELIDALIANTIESVKAEVK
jgi:hypothetical protein